MTAPQTPIDLRSDTVTLPTQAMFERMCSAELGDDSLDGDPTAQALEAAAAELLGHEAGLFIPTCTMANLLAVLVHTPRTGHIFLDADAHMHNTERGTNLFTQTTMRTLPGKGGEMDTDRLNRLMAAEARRGVPSLVCVETTHNASGGCVPSLDYMARVRGIAAEHGAAVHIDGARLFNASTALNVTPDVIAGHADSAAICLSKGLSAPAGAVLVGAADKIAAARGLRKLLGGTQRQIGVLAATGLEALGTMRQRLAEDHAAAHRLSAAINAAGSSLRADVPQTNIIRIDLSQTGRDANHWVAALGKIGVLVRPAGDQALRCVTHRHISQADAETAADLFVQVAAEIAALPA